MIVSNEPQALDSTGPAVWALSANASGPRDLSERTSIQRIARRIAAWSVEATPTALAYITAAFSALLLATAHTHPRLGWLVLLSLAPWCAVARVDRFWSMWLQLALMVGLSVAFSIQWIARTGPGFEWIVVMAAGYAAAFALVPAVLCYVAVRASRDAALGLLLLPVGFACMELLGRLTLLRVWWPITAQPAADWPLLSRGVALIGPEALAAPMLACAVALGLSLRRCATAPQAIAWIAGPALLLVLSGGAAVIPADGTGRVFKLGVVQPDIRQIEKWSADKRSEQLARMDALIDRLLPSAPELIVLPETAITGYVRYENDLTDWVRATVARTARPLLFGSLDRDATGANVRNVAILITPYNSVFTYAKMHLVPVTERVPELGPLTSYVMMVRGGSEQFSAGAAPTQFQLKPSIRFGSVICFEDIFPELVRANARNGAQFIVALINTERFRGSSQALQHLRRAQLSAAAVGLPIVRATNSGTTAYVDAYGRVRDEIRTMHPSAPAAADARVFEVRLTGARTLYRRFGDAASGAFLMLMSLALIVAWRRWAKRAQEWSARPREGN